MRQTILILLLGIATAQTVAANGVACQQVFRDGKGYALRFAAENKIPAMVLPNGVPSLLLNGQTYPRLIPFLKQSIGIVVAHQPNWHNDHGMFRLGEFVLDRDSPGRRARGELQETGISWVPVKAQVDYHSQNGANFVRLDVAFVLSPPEMSVVNVYQRMRRAALIRPSFDHGGQQNPGGNNKLENCGENCFSFSTGSSVRSQIYAIRTQLEKVQPDYEATRQRPEMIAYVEAVKKVLTEARWDDANVLDPLVTLKVKSPLEDGTTAETLNWYVALDISESYLKLLGELGIHSSSDYSNYRNPRAAAVLVHDYNVNAKDFETKDYVSKGIFSNYSHQDATEISRP